MAAALKVEKIKQHQLVCIASAGLEIAEKKTLSLTDIHFQIQGSYDRHCSLYLEEIVDSSIKLEFLKAKNLSDLTKKEDKGSFDGITLWRKFKELKAEILNVYNPIWAKASTHTN